MLKYLLLFERGLSKVEKVFVVFSGSIMCITVFMQVLFRYVFRVSVVWTEEVALISFVFTILMAASVVVVESSHIGFDALTAILPKRLSFIVWVFSNLVVSAFLVVMIWAGRKLVLAARTDQTVMLRIPMSVVYSIVLISGSTMLLHTVFGFLRDFRSKLTNSQTRTAHR